MVVFCLRTYNDLILLPANEFWGKVMFSQACVSHTVHRESSLCGGHTVKSGRHASYWNAFLLPAETKFWPR